MDNILEKIHKATLRFLVPLSPEETYKFIVEEGINLVKADYGSILLEKNNELQRVFASSPVLYKIKPRSHGFMFGVFKNRKSIILSSKTVSKIHPEIDALNINSDIIVPLSYRDKAIGVLTLMSSEENFFTKEDVKKLKLFSQMATLAIKKAELYEENKKALESRDLFISMAAHELRTPATTISGYTQLLYSKLAGANSSESRWVEELLAETRRLTLLINELLEVERIKTQQFNYTFHTNSLREIVRRVVSNFRFVHPNHNLIVNDNLGKDDMVISDFDKLIQVVDNLLDNAVKFSPEQSSICLVLDRGGRYFTIKVQDQGMGIKKEDLKTVFEKFNRGSDHTREGMGLGLFLAKSIIEAHQGKIKIRSKEYRGTEVGIKLPRIKHD